MEDEIPEVDEDTDIVQMGQLSDPMKRPKYSREELIDLIQKYEDTQEQIMNINNSLRETTFEVESTAK